MQMQATTKPRTVAWKVDMSDLQLQASEARSKAASSSEQLRSHDPRKAQVRIQRTETAANCNDPEPYHELQGALCCQDLCKDIVSMVRQLKRTGGKQLPLSSSFFSWRAGANDGPTGTSMLANGTAIAAITEITAASYSSHGLLESGK